MYSRGSGRHYYDHTRKGKNESKKDGLHTLNRRQVLPCIHEDGRILYLYLGFTLNLINLIYSLLPFLKSKSSV